MVLFLFKFEINISKTIRLIESIDKKFINVELAFLFNETCTNNILYTYMHRSIEVYIYIFVKIVILTK